MKKHPKPTVFVLIPSIDASQERYQLAIKPACEEVGAVCKQTEDFNFPQHILQEIYSQIAKADAIIADVSGASPNIWYEVGYAHALKKNLLLIAEKHSDIPFEFNTFRVILYRGSINILKDELTKAINSILNLAERETIERTRDILHGHHRDLAIVYSDIVGSTIMARVGELDFTKFLEEYNSQVKFLAQKYRGIWIRMTGDAFSAVFDSTSDAISFLLELNKSSSGTKQSNESPFLSRTVIHVGPGCLERITDYGVELFGEGLVIAARLSSLANPGEILVTEDALTSLPKGFIKVPLKVRLVCLKGREMKVAVIDLTGKGDQQ